MPLSDGPRAFHIDGHCTLDDLRAIIAQTVDEPGATEVRVHVRVPPTRHGATVRQVTLVRPVDPGRPA